MTIIDGKKISQEILSRVKAEVGALPFQPIFCDVLVGNDNVSAQYVEVKARTAAAIGVSFHRANFPASISTEELIEEIRTLNKIPKMCGVILQLPLPSQIDLRRALDAVDPEIDVDCLGAVAGKKFYEGSSDLGFPTALACMAVLDSLKLNLTPASGKKIAVLGRGELVGKPVSALLHFRGFSPVIIDNKSLNKEKLIKEADILISGIGQGNYITGDMIKRGAIIIDAGTSESGAGIIGDVDLDSVKAVAGYVSPVPGGVGPVTVAMLLSNVLKVAQKRLQK